MNITRVWRQLSGPALASRPAVVSGTLLTLAGAVFVFFYAHALPDAILHPDFNDSYFGSDIPRVWENLTDQLSNHYRAKVHPLFSLFVGLPTLAVVKLGLDRLTAVSLLLSVNAALLIILFYRVLLFITGRVLDSLLFTLLFMASASFVFWSHVPETMPFAGASVLLTFFVLSVPSFQSRETPLLVASIASLSMTTTNWMAGLAGSLSALGIKRAIVVAIKTLVIVAALWSFQKYVYPSAGHFLDLGEEHRFVEPAGWRTGIRQFVFDALTPRAVYVEQNATSGAPAVTLVSSHRVIIAGVIVTWLAWMAMLAYGAFCCWRERRLALSRTLLLFVAGQIALHSQYGTMESFMYSLNCMPALLLVAAYGTKGRVRPFLLVAVAAIAVYIAPRNFQLHQHSLALLQGMPR